MPVSCTWMGESGRISHRERGEGCGVRVKRRIGGSVVAAKSVVVVLVAESGSSVVLGYEGWRRARERMPPVPGRKAWIFSPEDMFQITMRASAPLDMSTSVPAMPEEDGEGKCVVRIALTKSVCPLR